MSDITLGQFDFQGLLGHLTNTDREDWNEIDGPDSGSGLDYWYANARTGAEAYINLDQTFLEISVDGENVFSEELDDMDPEHEAAKFFIFEPASGPAP